MNETPSFFMRQALSEAVKAWGMTSPNPLVGAVIVTSGQIQGRGYHREAGTPHAEINALADAGARSRGADMYVTLEPCSTTGRTPPCTEAIISSGIKKVYIGCLDPNPAHAGKAVDILKNAGLDVECEILEEECAVLNESFFKWITSGVPFVVLKMAMTLDGKIATENGMSKWITGPCARERVQKLRRWADAIMTGGETARLDRPSLNVREPADWPRQPLRIVATASMSESEVERLLGPGGKLACFRYGSGSDWREFLEKLGADNITSLLIEGGGELASAALDAGIVDKIEFHMAPRILGGRGSRPVIGGENPLSLESALDVDRLSVETVGRDLIVSGYIKMKNK